MCVKYKEKEGKVVKKILPIVALLGMMSFGVQEMNVRAIQKLVFGIRKERVLIS